MSNLKYQCGQLWGSTHEKSTPTTDITLKHKHIWWVPVYVLDSRLQNTKTSGLTKRDPRPQVGIYLGNSRFHTSYVALILNPLTGHISTQYHVILYE